MNTQRHWPRQKRHHLPAREKGSVLLTAMVFLIILTMIVLSVVRSGSLEERMASNDRDRQVALQAAEAVLREAEAALFIAPANATAASYPLIWFDRNTFAANCTGGYCSAPASNADPRWQTIDWASTTKTRTFANATSKISDGLGELPTQPRYIVELAPESEYPLPAKPVGQQLCSQGVVTLTARGEGRDNAVVFIQSIYRFRPATC